MNPENPIPTTETIHNPLQVMQPGEQVICEIKRHPAGMFGIYAISSAIIVAIAILVLVVAPAVFSGSRSSVMGIGMAIFLLATIIIVGLVFIANKIYWGNSWVVSSDSITQISQTSLFHRQSSQLSLGNLEDVTSDQQGVFAQLFRFGTLKAETAGERSKFTFTFCPNPNYYAQKILAAREAFEQGHHGGKQEPFSSAGNPPSPAAAESQPPADQAPIFPNVPYDNRS